MSENQSKQQPQNINVNVSAAPIVIRDKDSGPSWLTQLVWFAFIGWWLSQLAMLAGYFLIVTVILLPIGFALLNRVPKLATMRSFDKEIRTKYKDGMLIVENSFKEQRPWYVRLIYFIVIGFWFGAIVLELAWLLTASIILTPVGLALFRFAPKALTLRR